ncbi:MAG: sigma-54 dependent transcriptional regulator [Deltaproteobacteria bacterium]|nr:sigma-54 dependent transcriptional regulator [Deltaproteobacteria bacterium]
MEQKKILIVDDDGSMRHMLSLILKREGYEVQAVGKGSEALNLVASESFDFILSDVVMPGMGGLELLQALKEKKVEATVIMMSAYGNLDTAVEAMKRGAYDYISKPFRPDEVLLALRKAEERENLRKENLRLRREVSREYAFGNIVGKSPKMMQLFDTIKKISEYKTSVLIIGESGTGKEMVARCIHYNSPRNNGPFEAINCGAIPETLLESELFGHEKGAFTDAKKEKLGSFEMAHQGTLFLDEVGEMSLTAQVKLLRVLQEGEVKRLGSERTFTVDVRIIAATIQDLSRAAAEGKFREDLFYRLNVLPVHLPPLRERKEDIPLLVEHFIHKYNEQHRLNTEGAAEDVLARLLEYSWPGNVRELENAIERAMILAQGKKIEADCLPSEVLGTRPSWKKDLWGDEYSIKKASRIMEEELIRKALKKTGGNRSHAVKILEISHPALLSKIKEYGIED